MDNLTLTNPANYDDVSNFSAIKNVLFINTAAQSLRQYVNTDDTFAILYDNTSTTDEVMQCFRRWFPDSSSSLDRIGFAFHYGGADSIPFMNQKTLFTDSDLGDSVVTFSPNMQFMLDLLREFRTVTHVDFLACGTLLNEKCKQYYNLLQSKTGVVIGASDDNTGNIKYGGDWIMESTHEDVEGIYFTAGITNWASLLVDVSYTDSYGVTYTQITGTLTATITAVSDAIFPPSTSYVILSNFTVNNINYTVTTIFGYKFPSAKLISVTIPSTVIALQNESFYMLSNLNTVFYSVPSSLRTIGSKSFFYTKLSYIWLPYGVTTIGYFALFKDEKFPNNSPTQLMVLPSTLTTLDSTAFWGGNGPTTVANLYMFTSGDSGVTCTYKKYKLSSTSISGEAFNLIITGFKTSYTNTLTWEPVVSIAVTSSTTYYVNMPFTVTFNTFIPSTTYTITGLTAVGSSSSGTLTDGTSSKIFTPTVAGTITISMSDRSVPISIVTVADVNAFNHTFYTMKAATPTILTRSIYDNLGILKSTQDISFGGMNISAVLSLLDGGDGTNPYTIGMVDASANRICMDLAYCNVYTQGLTSTQQALLMTNVNTTYKEPHTAAYATYTVTVSGGVFWVSTNSATAVARPTLTLTAGNLYVFDQSADTNVGKPLRLSTTVDGPTVYKTGVVTNGTPGSLNAYTLIDVSVTTPVLYYYCTTTSGMGQYAFYQTNMVLWIDASNTTIGDNTSVKNTTGINRIVDRSSAARTIYGFGNGSVTFRTSGLKTNYPGYVLTNGGIRFDMPANTFLNTINIGEFSFFCVFKNTGTTTSTSLCSRCDNNQAAFFDWPGNAIYFKSVAENGTSFDVKNYTNPTICSMNISYTSTTISVNQNWYFRSGLDISYNSLSYTRTNPGVNTDTATRFCIGGRDDNSNGFIGVISEVITFNSFLDSTTSDSIVSYLRTKWSI